MTCRPGNLSTTWDSMTFRNKHNIREYWFLPPQLLFLRWVKDRLIQKNYRHIINTPRSRHRQRQMHLNGGVYFHFTQALNYALLMGTTMETTYNEHSSVSSFHGHPVASCSLGLVNAHRLPLCSSISELFIQPVSNFYTCSFSTRVPPPTFSSLTLNDPFNPRLFC